MDYQTDKLKAEKRERSTFAIYDLPIEYHRNSLAEWMGAHTDHHYGPEDKAMNQYSPNSRYAYTPNPEIRTTIFRNLNPDFLLKRVKQRRDFNYVRKLAIRKLEDDIILKLRIIHESQKCKYGDDINMPLSHPIFSWCKLEWLKRRKVKETIWIDVLQKEKEKCLGVIKFRHDLEELERYLLMIFEALRNSDYKYEFHDDENVRQSLNEATEILDIVENLEKDLATNTKTMHGYLNELIKSAVNKTDQESRRKRLITVEEQLMNAHIVDPIQIRYETNTYRSRALQAEERLGYVTKKYDDEVTEYIKKVTAIQYCTGCAIDAHYSEIDKYKSRIDELTENYEKEYDKMENEISYKKTLLEKLKDQMKFMKDEIIRFREEIQLMRLRIIKENEQKALLAAKHLQYLILLEQKRLKKEQKKLRKNAKKK